jgi:hypothetical protein
MEYQGIDLSTAQQRCRPKSANFALDKQTAATLRYYLLVAAGWSSVAMGESVAFDSIKLSCGETVELEMLGTHFRGLRPTKLRLTTWLVHERMSSVRSS